MKFNHSLVVTTLLLLSSTSYSALAGLVNLGAATNYNAFIHHDFLATSSDVEGRMAVGGNLTISNYSVNIKGNTQLYTDTTNSPALVVGGDLDFSSGQIAGNVFVGGGYTPTPTGTITNGTLLTSGPVPINFDAEFEKLTNLALNLSLIDANSTANILYSAQHLAGSGSNGLGNDLHVFSLDAADMQLTDYLLSGVDSGDTVLLNIAGKDITTSWGNFGGSDLSLEKMSSNILFNFFEAETLNINAAIFGSILAPSAKIKAPTGVIWGQVIAESWEGNTQINDNPFLDASVKVPEPSSVVILGLACLGLVFRKKAV